MIRSFFLAKGVHNFTTVRTQRLTGALNRHRSEKRPAAAMSSRASPLRSDHCIRLVIPRHREVRHPFKLSANSGHQAASIRKFSACKNVDSTTDTGNVKCPTTTEMSRLETPNPEQFPKCLPVSPLESHLGPEKASVLEKDRPNSSKYPESRNSSCVFSAVDLRKVNVGRAPKDLAGKERSSRKSL